MSRYGKWLVVACLSAGCGKRAVPPTPEHAHDGLDTLLTGPPGLVAETRAVGVLSSATSNGGPDSMGLVKSHITHGKVSVFAMAAVDQPRLTRVALRSSHVAEWWFDAPLTVVPALRLVSIGPLGRRELVLAPPVRIVGALATEWVVESVGPQAAWLVGVAGPDSCCTWLGGAITPPTNGPCDTPSPPPWRYVSPLELADWASQALALAPAGRGWDDSLRDCDGVLGMVVPVSEWAWVTRDSTSLMSLRVEQITIRKEP